MNTENEATEAVEETQILSVEERNELAEKRVRQYVMGSMAVGIIPFPLIDLAALSTLQLKMLHSLANIYDVEFKAHIGKSAISSLVGSALPVASAAPVAASLTKFVPVVGHAISYGTLVVLNGASTYAIGKVFDQHFASGGTFLTFKPEAVREYFTEQFEKGKTFASSLSGNKEAATEETRTATNQPETASTPAA